MSLGSQHARRWSLAWRLLAVFAYPEFMDAADNIARLLEQAVEARVQRTQAAAVYLQTYPLLPYERTAETLDDLFGVRPSEGTLASTQATAYTRLEPVEQAIGTALQRADVAHVDETSQRVAGRTEWVHVISTALLTFYAW